MQDIHILRWHLFLILAESVKTPKRDIRVSDAMLPGGKELKIVALLQNGTVVRRNV